MSRRAIKSINWAAMIERVPEQQKSAFAAFKTKSDLYLRRMTANPEAAPQIDWEYYSKNVTIPGLVEKFRKEYESLKIPYPADNYTSLIDDEEKAALAEIEQFRIDCESDIEKANVEIASLNAIMPYAEMTLEEFLEYHPEYETGTANRPTIWPHTPDMIEAEKEALKQEAEGEH